MKKINYKKRSLIVLYALGGLVILFLAISGFYFYNSYQEGISKNLHDNSHKISNYLEDVFSQTESWLVVIADVVKKSSKEALKILEEMDNSTNNLAHSLFWLSSDLQLTSISSRFGKKSYDLSQSLQLKGELDSAQKIHIFPSFTITSSGLREVNMLVDVSDQKEENCGYVGIGLGWFNLTQRLEDLISGQHTSYILLNSQFKIILASSDCPLAYESSYFRDRFFGKSEPIFSAEEGTLTVPITVKDITYTLYKKIKNYPVYLLVGNNKFVSHKNFEIMLLPRVMEILLLALLVYVLMYLLRQRFLAIADASQNAKELFVKTLKMQMQTTLDNLLSECFHLKLLHKEKNFNMENVLSSIDAIAVSAKKLEMLSSEKEIPSLIDLNGVVESCKLIVEHSALLYGVIIRLHKDSTLPLLLTQEIGIKQVVVGILSLAIRYFNEQKIVTISTKYIPDQGVAKITVSGSGLIDFDRIEHFERNQKDFITNNIYDLKFSLKAIQRLVDSLDGQMTLDNGNKNRSRAISIYLRY